MMKVGENVLRDLFTKLFGSATRRSVATAWALPALAVAALGAVPSGAAGAPGFDRHYELATPPDKASQPVRVSGLSPDGRTVSFANYQTGNGLPGTESQMSGGVNSYLGLRGDGAWRYESMGLSAAAIPQPIFRDATPQLDLQLFTGVVDANAARSALFSRRPREEPKRISPVLTNLDGATQKDWAPNYVGSSQDLSHVVLAMLISSGGRLLPDDPSASTYSSSADGRQLYESVGGDSPTLRRVDVGADGQVLGHCGAILGSAGHVARAISDDGRRIFFSATDAVLSDGCFDPVTNDLYARVDGAQTERLTDSECHRVADPAATPPVEACSPKASRVQYESASGDGERVFFTTSDQLVSSDTDGSKDLYMYDFRAPPGARLTQLSAGDSTDVTPGAGAEVQGFLRASVDGSRSYFVARGVLTTVPNSAQGVSAVEGGNNLYLAAADGEIKFVATLADDSEIMWNYNDEGGFRQAQLADSAGRYLIFASATALTDDDFDVSSDIYAYDAQSGTMERVSVGRDGFGDNGNSDADGAFMSGPAAAQLSPASATAQSRQVSGDGSRVVFSTTQALEPDDVNALSDVYEWRDGQVRMVSDGQDANGVGAGGGGFVMSEDGSTVAFSTWQRLLPDRDVDSAADVYVARTGPDVDSPPPGPPAPCVGAACQGVRSSDPGPSVGAGSSAFLGGGNIVPPVASAKQANVRVTKAKAARGAATTIKVQVSGRGKIRTSGSGLERVQKTAKAAGAYRLRVKLTKRAQRTLRRTHRVTVRMAVRFTSHDGEQSSARVSLTFKSNARQATARRASVSSSVVRKDR